eukprot:PLAT817.1.p1 GENE.PLAT817.1~~PLAT817.1.p1  ORF type:complete len:492 (-),score=174.15 PLAT817.1:59-1315(-)
MGDDMGEDFGETAGDEAGEPVPSVRDDSLRSFELHGEPVYALDVYESRGLALSGGGDDRAYIWSLDDGQVLHALIAHSDSVTAVGFSHDGSLAATASYDGTVRLWSVDSGEQLQCLEPGSEVEWLQWHPSGLVVLAGTQDGTAWMWNSAGVCLNVFSGHIAPVTCGAFVGKKRVVTASLDSTVRSFKPMGAHVHTFSDSSAGRIPWAQEFVSLAVHPVAPLILVGSLDGYALLLNVKSDKVLARLEHPVVHEAEKPAMPAVRTVAPPAASEDEEGMEEEAEGEEGESKEDVGGEEGEEEGEDAVSSVESVAFCQSQNWAASGCLDGSVQVWDCKTMASRHTLMHSEPVIRLLWHPREPLLVTACRDGSLHLWDARTGEEVRPLLGHRLQVLDMSFATVGEQTLLVTAGDDGAVLLFEL